MIPETVGFMIANYGGIGVLAAVLLWERVDQKKIQREQTSENIAVLQAVSKNMALVNDNLKDLKLAVQGCGKRK